ncbi:MAG TPA: mannitol dehydrogenase family protein [Capillimicrobium sp.]
MPSVVHLGVGSFHRAHQALYLDELAQRGISRRWGLIGVGMRSREMHQALAPQDWLYTVVSRGAGGDRARVVGVMTDYIVAPDSLAAVLAALAHPRTRLVTLTVTGAGYESSPDGHPPRTAVAYIVEALRRRRAAGLGPFTVLSCDNLAGNGSVARAAVTALARRRDPRLAAWIEEHATFPDSMVDRITPQTTDADRQLVAETFGVDDLWPVITEPFSDFVVQDEFCAGRPPLDEVGVRMVTDVRPYALAKTRLLNASHCALGSLALLAGHAQTATAMDDPVFGAYVERLMGDEVAPLLPPARGLDLEAYQETILERLANPKVGDQLERLCRNGSHKIPAHVVSSIALARAEGRPHELLTLAVAGWLRFLRGRDDMGRALDVDDPLGEPLRELARAHPLDPRPILAQRELFGEIAGDALFAAQVEEQLRAFDRQGVRAAVQAALSAAGDDHPDAVFAA